jgi:hypothetical protein
MACISPCEFCTHPPRLAHPRRPDGGGTPNRRIACTTRCARAAVSKVTGGVRVGNSSSQAAVTMTSLLHSATNSPWPARLASPHCEIPQGKSRLSFTAKKIGNDPGMSPPAAGTPGKSPMRNSARKSRLSFTAKRITKWRLDKARRCVGPKRARFRHHPRSVDTRGPPMSAFPAEHDLAGSTLYRQATARRRCVINDTLGPSLILGIGC